MEAKKICILEDEVLISHAISLSEIGERFEIITASNGKEGLELIRAEKPDLVLTDLLMPEMDGFEVLEAIKADDAIKDIPIVILSNDASEENRKKAQKLGAADFFEKADSDLGVLARKITTILNKS